ncbi:MAG: T9SS type A sorting domain-containing protein [Candidatus Zixiibacteriota bacterium]
MIKQRMKTIKILGILFMAVLAFSQMPHAKYGYVENYDSSIPLAECLTFKAFKPGVEETDTIYYIYPGSEYTCNYYEDSGMWKIRADVIEAFAGDTVSIVFRDTCFNTICSVDVEITDASPDFESEPVILNEDTYSMNENMPVEKSIAIASPNPFNSSVLIQTGEVADYDITVFDIIGKKIDSFTRSEKSEVIWNVDDSDISSGVYFIKIKNIQSEKAQFVKVIYQK